MLENIDGYKKYKEVEKEFLEIKRKTVPLCAAENIISPFVKIPLSGEFQERYIMDGVLSYRPVNNFIGSSSLHDIYELISYQCKKLYNADYADARTLSGMNCVTSLLMSITSNGDKIMVSDNQCGGHQSMEFVCQRLGLEIIKMPYDYENFTIDYDRTYKILKEEKIAYFLYAPSDIINPPEYEKLKLPEETVFLYDASQTLGLIAGKQVDNPIEKVNNSIVFGGTHKTLPGPANGLIMTCSRKWAQKIDSTISPKYLRHTQMHQVVSLLFALFEMEAFGEEYAYEIISLAQKIGKELINLDMSIPVINQNKVATCTHQIFIKTTEEEMNRIFSNAFKHNLTLNKKNKKLFNMHGIRIGTQEIARLAWNNDPSKQIANIIHSLLENENIVPLLIKELNIPKDIRFTFKKVEDSF